MLLGPGIKTGLNIRIDNPAQLGADLVAGAVAAVAKYPLPLASFLTLALQPPSALLMKKVTFRRHNMRRRFHYTGSTCKQNCITPPY